MVIPVVVAQLHDFLLLLRRRWSADDGRSTIFPPERYHVTGLSNCASGTFGVPQKLDAMRCLPRATTGVGYYMRPS